MAPSPLPTELTQLLQLSLPHTLTTSQLSLLTSSLLSSSHSSRSLSLTLLAKFLSPSPSGPNSLLLKSTLRDLLNSPSSEDYAQAFAVLSALFKVVPSTAEELLKSDEGIKLSLAESVEIVSSSTSSESALVALLELLSLASSHSSLRSTIRQSSGKWVESLISSAKDEKVEALAGVTVAKLRLGKEKPEEGGTVGGATDKDTFKWSLSMEALVTTLQNIIVSSPSPSSSSSDVAHEGEEDIATSASLEALALLTLSPSLPTSSLKNSLSSSTPFLSKLVSLVSPKRSNLHYAISSLLLNLMSLPPILSDDEISRLKSYAASNGGSEEEKKMEEKSSVLGRQKKLVEIKGVLGMISILGKSNSGETRRGVSKIILSLSEDRNLRGKLLGAGLAKTLLSILENTSGKGSGLSLYKDLIIPAQALSKFLITTNPSLVFEKNRLLDVSRVLGVVIGNEWSTEEGGGGGGQEGLIKFEALMALTNIASLDLELAEKIASMGVVSYDSSLVPLPSSTPTPLLTILSNLLLSPIPLLLRATTELICNLSPTSSTLSYFALSPSAGNTLHILMALCTSEDSPTALAAGGSLATLSGVSEIAKKLVGINAGKSFEKILDLIGEEEEEGMRVRVYAVLEAVAEMGGSEGKEALGRMKVGEKLKESVKREKGDLKLAAQEALGAIEKALK